jgi:hypothetical protein
MKICENCQSLITAKRGKRRFCSISCLNEHQKKNGNNINKSCVDCGNIFSVPISNSKRIVRCKLCISKKFTGMVEKLCVICGSSFKVKPYRRNLSKYCSNECRHKVPVVGRKVLKKIECEFCKKTFQPISSKTKFCSKECFDKSREKFFVCQNCGISFKRRPRTMKPEPMFCGVSCRAEYISGENHHGYRGGRYLDRDGFDLTEWKNKIRPAILDRDHYTCKRCNATQETSIIHVHHIIPWYLTKDNSQENLISLCISCHKFVEENYANKGDFSLSFIP